MRLAPLLLILLLTTPALAEEFIFDDTLYNAEWIDLTLTVENTITLTGDVRTLEAHLNQVPEAFQGQAVTSQSTTPQARQENDGLTYSWTNPRHDVSLTYTGTIKSAQQRPRITERTTYPYDIPPALAPYLQSQEIIQITPEIRALADDITRGEDDAVRATFLLGRWVKDHIEYDLTSVTADASQTSQWVLDNRRGVCDELTSLFIALARSQGIPARFVSGIAYTNLEELDTHWGPHGWAEVWYPEVGWVPYDITYGQYGYLDATHLALQHSPDAQTTAAEYRMSSVGGDFHPQGLARTVTVADRGPQATDPLTASITTALTEAGFGGANRVDVTVTNPTNEYRAAEVYLIRAQGLTTTDYTRSILLGPHEERTLNWIVHVDEDLDPRFEYTFPIAAQSNTNMEARTAFTGRRGAPVVDAESLAVEEEQGATPIQGAFTCEAPTSVRQQEPITITCTAEHEARICIEDDCATGDEHAASIPAEDLGVTTIVATADRREQHSRRILSVRVLDEPRINLSVDAPATINASDEGAVRIHVEADSQSVPEDVEVRIDHPLFEQSWSVGTLDRPATLELRFKGDQLMSGENTLQVTATHAEGREETSATIRPIPHGPLERFTLWINWVVGTLLA